MPARRAPVIVLGLDSLDPGLARVWADAGELPNLAKLFAESARCEVRNPTGLYVGALWPSFATGLGADRHDFYCWSHINRRTYRREANPPRLGRFPTLWSRLSDAGRRVAVVDVPHFGVDGPVNGVQIAEWGAHDRHFGLQSWPAEEAERIVATAGLHPIFGADPYSQREFSPDDFAFRSGIVRTADEERQLLEGLVAGARAKGRGLAALRRREDWDLFLAVFGESHSAGHQLWHLHDPSDPKFDQERQRALGGDPLLRVYKAIDDAIGEIAAGMPGDGRLLVLLSLGFGPISSGIHLLEDVLTRLDRWYKGAAAKPSAAGGLRGVAEKLRRRVAAIPLPRQLRLRAGAAVDAMVRARARARQLWFAEPNNSVFGGVRLNVAGREARGIVDPAETDALLDLLETDLKALVDPETGGRAVRALIRADRHYRRSPENRMPDLFVEWERSAPFGAVWSPKIGRVAPAHDAWRTGDHRETGLLLARTAEAAAGEQHPQIAVEDIAPTVAAMLGVDFPDADGRVIGWLARERVAVAAAAE
jgi:predicted AlkP superfamily phosphohydrolase/phosphomutase